MAFGAFEGGTGGWFIEGLFFLAAFSEVLHACFDRCRVILFHLEFHRKNDIPFFIDTGMAVGKIKLGLCQCSFFPFACQDGDGMDHVFHFIAICAGVHDDRAANCSRDTGQSFHPGEPIF